MEGGSLGRIFYAETRKAEIMTVNCIVSMDDNGRRGREFTSYRLLPFLRIPTMSNEHRSTP